MEIIFELVLMVVFAWSYVMASLAIYFKLKKSCNHKSSIPGWSAYVAWSGMVIICLSRLGNEHIGEFIVVLWILVPIFALLDWIYR